jgi:hypothetical protein
MTAVEPSVEFKDGAIRPVFRNDIYQTTTREMISAEAFFTVGPSPAEGIKQLPARAEVFISIHFDWGQVVSAIEL